jgi:hypothetical protein
VDPMESFRMCVSKLLLLALLLIHPPPSASPASPCARSPSNPLGVTYSEEQMRDLLAWCLMRRCHCIRCVWTSRNDLVDLPLNLQIFNLP